MILHGNTTGLAPSDVHTLERLYRRRVPFDQLVTRELAFHLAECSHTTGRQVGVLIDRNGDVRFVVVGDAAKLMLPDLGRMRAGSRFRGLRLVHTHLRSEPLTRDDLVDLTRLRLDLVLSICVTPEGQPGLVHWAHNVPVTSDDASNEPFRKYGPVSFAKLDGNPAIILRAVEEEYARIAKLRPVVAKDGRAILVHVCTKKDAKYSADSLRELKELARTAGVEVTDTVLQVRDALDPKLVLGRGKLEDVVLRAMQLDADVLIFDRELGPAQAAAIAQHADMRVLDRTQLILDIFAQRAESRDGKLQVELAQMKYLLPRLGLKDDALSRLTGGIGGRGPGETKLEIGKRRARERVSHLEKQIGELARQRKQRRARRDRRGVPIVAIVGYTNAGKSTLLNALTESTVLAEDKLFATLDTRSRRLRFPEEREVILTDTVGFIRDLPKDLFAAFRATFEEAQDADLLLHVVDASDASHAEHVETTEALLGELDLLEVPRLVVFNKMDLCDERVARALARVRGGLAVSAENRATLAPLLERMGEMLFAARGDDPVPRLPAVEEDLMDTAELWAEAE